MGSTTSDRRYTGKVCESHPETAGLRYKCNNRCVECSRSAHDAWVVTNRDKLRKTQAKYRKKNRKKLAREAKVRRWMKNGIPKGALVMGMK